MEIGVWSPGRGPGIEIWGVLAVEEVSEAQMLAECPQGLVQAEKRPKALVPPGWRGRKKSQPRGGRDYRRQEENVSPEDLGVH